VTRWKYSCSRRSLHQKVAVGGGPKLGQSQGAVHLRFTNADLSTQARLLVVPNRDGVSDVPMLCSTASDAVACALSELDRGSPPRRPPPKHLTGLGEWLRARIKKCEE